MLRIILLLAVSAFSNADLVAPFTVDLLNSKHPFWDSVVVTTYVSNIGSTSTITKQADFVVASIGIDSFVPIRNHSMPATYFLGAGGQAVFRDTIIAFRGPFAIVTQADPIHVFQEVDIGNDVRSQAYNFHPQILRDTVLLIDTLKITVHDTVKVSIHDTVKYCPPTMAKTSGAYMRPSVATTVYNAVGQPEWTGMAPEGGFPSERLKAGLHLIVQGQNARRFRVAYK